MTNTSTNETNQDTFYNAIKTVFDNWTGYQVIIEWKRLVIANVQKNVTIFEP